MAKKQAGKVGPSLVRGIPVPDESGFKIRCTEAIKKAVPGCKPHIERHDNWGNIVWRASVPERMEARAGNRRYLLLPFGPHAARTRWIAIQLEFVPAANLRYLHSVTILIFEGQFNETKKPLLRGEWDCASCVPLPKLAAHHAQPHWHVYPGRINGTEVAFEQSTDFEEFELLDVSLVEIEEQDGVWPRGELFHFSMSALFHLPQENIHITEPVIDQIPCWIANCISYIRKQLDYLDEKLPSNV